MLNARIKYLPFIFLVFFVSGMTGLIYEVLWSKYLSNIFGSSTYASAIVISVFMGGLAFGNYFLGHRADKVKMNLLYLYGLLEIGIGLYCFVYPDLVTFVENIYQRIGWSLNLQSTNKILFLVQFILNALTIFFPTTLMGGTLPILAKYITRRERDILNRVSSLYFINSVGAVVGSLICGFILIRLFGLDFSITLTAIINVLLGVFCLGLAKKGGEILLTEETNDEGVIKNWIPPGKEQQYLSIILMTAGVSGFASMLYEIIWIRTLIQFIGSSVYSFSIVVAAFIAGISLGSAWLSRRQDNMKNPYEFLGVIQGLIALTMYVCVANLGIFAQGIWWLQQIFAPSLYAYPVFQLCKFLFIFILLLVPCFFMGISLPLASALSSEKLVILGSRIGNVFSVNLIGALAGTLMGGLILLPGLGTIPSFLIGIILNAVMCFVIFLSMRKSGYRKCIGFSLILILVIIAFPTQFNQNIVTASMFRSRLKDIPFNEFINQKTQNRKILFYKEDANCNVAISQNEITKDVSLLINGKVDASSGVDMPTQLLSGHLPALLHPNPKKVLVIGFGSGVTVGALTLYPTIERIDCLEISEAVISAGRYFKNVNHDCLHNPKVKIIVDDAKSFLLLNKDKYDVIISEPTNPWTAGTGALMTIESFRQMKEALTENGILLQWFHTYEMSDEIFKSFGATLFDVFDHVTVWQPLKQDCFFVATQEPLKIDQFQIQKKMEQYPEVASSLSLIDGDSLYSLLSSQVLSEAKAHNIFYKSNLINRDQYPYIEFNAPRDFYLNKSVSLIEKNDERLMSCRGEELLICGLLKKTTIPSEDLEKMFYYLRRHNEKVFKAFTVQYFDEIKDLLKKTTHELIEIQKFKDEAVARKMRLDQLEKLTQEFPSKYEIFKEFSERKIEFYLAMNTVFLDQQKMEEEIIRLLKKGQESFPAHRIELGFYLGDFLRDIGQKGNAKNVYLKLLANPQSNDRETNLFIRKKLLSSVIEFAFEEKDKNFLRKIEEWVAEATPADWEILRALRLTLSKIE